MVLKQVLPGLNFNGHVVVLFNGVPICGGSPEKIVKKCGYYEVKYSCVRDGVLLITCK